MLEANIILGASLAEVIENHFPAALENLAHLGRKIEIGFEAERAGNVVKEGSLDGYGIDDMEAEERAVKTLGQPDRVFEGAFRMLRTVQRNKDILDHAALQS